MNTKIRKASQLFFLALYLLLLYFSAWTVVLDCDFPANIFLRTDPLFMLSTLLSSRVFFAGLLISLVTLILTLILGRFYCGWVCPLGAIFDIFGGIGNSLKKADNSFFLHIRSILQHKISKTFKYLLLIILLASAALGVNLAGLFDPLSILTRTLAINSFTKVEYISFSFILTAAIFILLICFSYYLARFWCMKLCPLGACLGLTARFGLLGREVSGCIKCGKCKKVCPMHTIDNEFKSKRAECILCLKCKDSCKNNSVEFKFRRPVQNESVDISKRRLITGVLAGLAFAPFIKLLAGETVLLRPPGVREEKNLLEKCVRCGKCMRVCPTGVIQPELFNHGLDGLYAPVMAPRIGYCKHTCNACGKVCPSGAIPRLALPAKQKFCIGTAEFDKNTCLPWSKDENCDKCFKICPVEAISLKNTNRAGKILKLPSVNTGKCIGCGACEYICPVSGSAGILVRIRGQISSAANNNWE